MPQGHGDHANREVHRPLSVASPLIEGPDVSALQGAVNKFLAANKLNGHLEVDGEFGERTAALTNKAGYGLGLEAAGDSPDHITRIVVQDEQHDIRNPDGRSDAQKERSKRRIPEMQQKERENGAGHPGSLRDKILENALWGVANTVQIHYRQSRPIDGHGSPRKLPLYTDCSGFATDCYEWAGAPDPNGRGFDGYGYTGTMLQACRHIAKAEALPGDLVVYGSFPGMHVVLLREPGSVADPMTISHGQEAGPLLVRGQVSRDQRSLGSCHLVRILYGF